MNRFAAIFALVLLLAFALLGTGCNKIKIPGNVAGQIFNEGGVPTGFISVQLVAVDSGEVAQQDTASDSGNFMFQKVDPGKYTIKTFRMGTPPVEVLNDCEPFNLRPGKTQTLEIHLKESQPAGGEQPEGGV